MENDFFKYLEGKFTLSRLRDDIEYYLEYKEGSATYMPAGHEFEAEEKLIEYKQDDSLTLISISAKRRYNGLSAIPFIVAVGIGDCIIDSQTGYCEVSKCIAEVLYNDDFEMFSIDFIYRQCSDERL